MTPEQIKEQITERFGTPDYYHEKININKLCDFLSTLISYNSH